MHMCISNVMKMLLQGLNRRKGHSYSADIERSQGKKDVPGISCAGKLLET